MWEMLVNSLSTLCARRSTSVDEAARWNDDPVRYAGSDEHKANEVHFDRARPLWKNKKKKRERVANPRPLTRASIYEPDPKGLLHCHWNSSTLRYNVEGPVKTN